MQIHRRNSMPLPMQEEFSGSLVSVSAHQDGRVCLTGEAPGTGAKWRVSFSAREASKLLAKLAAELTRVNCDAADNVAHRPVLSDADNPHFVENHR